MERIIGDYGNVSSDTLLLSIGSIHGNEVSGMKALERVFAYLQRHHVPISGRFIGLRGNINAIKQNRRYLDKDMNRVWSDSIIESALRNPTLKREYRELKEIIEVYEQINFSRYTQKIFLDLHTTSAENGTFVLVEDLPSSQHIVKHLHAPLVLGLHNGLFYTTVPYMHMKGFISIGFEAGKIGTHEAIDNQELTIWQVLRRSGLVEQQHIPLHIQTYTHLQDKNAHLPKRLKLDYKHQLGEGDGFKMRRGFKNFDPVQKGDLLAHDRKGPIYAPTDGFMLMPLYQSEGEDGFFLISEIDESELVTGKPLA